jgi:hypothetical protein
LCVCLGVYYQAIAKMKTVGNQETSIYGPCDFYILNTLLMRYCHEPHFAFVISIILLLFM